MGGNLHPGGGHDPRFIDLLAAVFLLLLCVVAYEFYTDQPGPTPTTAFIVPSQTTRW